MYRIFIILLLFPLCLFSQNKLKQEFEIEKLLSEGLYKDAEILLSNLYEKDSTNNKILFKYINTLYKSKNYIQLIKITDNKLNYISNEKDKIICFFLIGNSYKSLGKFQKALENFNSGFALNQKVRLTDYNSRFKRSIESCSWAIKSVNDTLRLKEIKLFDTIINKQTTIGHAWKHPYFIYSTNYIKDSTTSDNMIIAKDCSMKIKFYNTEKNIDSEINNINSPFNHAINASFTDDKKQFYFSSCKGNQCKVLVANYKDGKWENVDTLSGDINESNASYTMPSYAKIGNKEYLFFCSDKKGGRGGLDIYMGEIKNRKTIVKTKNLTRINSLEDDITPYWDNKKNNLYFSSSWHNGFGGFDVFRATLEKGNITNFENVGLPINSTANDLYYFDIDTVQIVSSNRGIYENNCCNKIHLFKEIKDDDEEYINRVESDTLLTFENSIIRIKQKEKHINFLKHIFPVALYFHNDIPNPKSIDTVTNSNYLETYTDYLELNETYKREYSKGIKHHEKLNTQAEIDLFFNNYVIKGYNELNKLLDILSIELNHGASFQLTIKGYASPLAKSKYNEYLSKRRINSIRNYIYFYNNGSLQKFLTDTSKVKLTFKEIPFGENNANIYVSDNPNDQRNSIYSIQAALERKIEILGVEETDNEIIQHISVDNQHINLGICSKNKIQEIAFTLENKNPHSIEINKLTSNCDCIQFDNKSIILQSNEKIVFKAKINLSKLKGEFEKSIYLKSNTSISYLRLVITGKIE
jgi:hypothetical protein